MPTLPLEAYQVGWICALPKEMAAARLMLDEEHEELTSRVAQDNNSYVLGSLHGHNVVIACLPAGRYGTTSAAVVASNMLRTFTGISFGLMVGIGAGVPNSDKGWDIRLGDVVVSQPDGTHGGVVQYDLGKNQGTNSFELKGSLLPPPTFLLTALANLQSRQLVYPSMLSQTLENILQQLPHLETKGFTYPGSDSDVFYCANPQHHDHERNPTCSQCREGIIHRSPRPEADPVVHYGTIASGNGLMKNAIERDRIGQQLGAKCIEMEAAGLMNDFPCIVIRGICDYADSSKNDVWQEYAAITAAAFAKELLQAIKPVEIPATSSKLDAGSSFRFGLSLFDAPDIDRGLFIGRDSEIEAMENAVQTQSPSLGVVRKVLVLGGPGGIGKTQLAIAFAYHCHDKYDSVFWLNATSESALQASLQRMAEYLFPDSYDDISNAKRAITRIKSWLSDLNNKRWLLIFDNHDEPEVYSLQNYYPYVAQGTIVITTRAPTQISGYVIMVKALQDMYQSLQILETRSQRSGITDDPGARRLVKRLGGLPLALATAGAYLRQTTSSFEHYLEAYERQWHSASSRSVQLHEYENRTLYTTWDLSYTRLQRQDEDAAKFLKLLAYFGNEALWFEHFHAGINETLPQWLLRAVDNVDSFNDVMRILSDYCFVEVLSTSQTYSVHTCVHDWTLAVLNKEVEGHSYWYAFDCIANSIAEEEWQALGNVKFARVVPHALRLAVSHLDATSRNMPIARLHAAHSIASLLSEQDRLISACVIAQRILDVTLGTPQVEIIQIVAALSNLSKLYSKQDRFDEAEESCRQALTEYGETLDAGDYGLSSVMIGLGMTLTQQGKKEEAEQLLLRALAGREKRCGANHNLTLNVVFCLGICYRNWDRLTEAEPLLLRALDGYEKTLGPEHVDTVETVNELGILYLQQDRLEDAERLFLRVLEWREKTLGSMHTKTLDTLDGLGTVCLTQDRLEEAEELYLQVLLGYQQAYSPEHSSTLRTIRNLAMLYEKQGRIEEAQNLYLQVIKGFENSVGPEHRSTLGTSFQLALLHWKQGDSVKAEPMFQRILAGREKTLGPDHDLTLKTVCALGLCYLELDRQFEAEQTFRRALIGCEKLLGSDHEVTKAVANKLEKLVCRSGLFGER